MFVFSAGLTWPPCSTLAAYKCVSCLYLAPVSLGLHVLHLLPINASCVCIYRRSHLASMLALLSSRKVTMFWWPEYVAWKSAVQPFLSLASSSAPCCHSNHSNRGSISVLPCNHSNRGSISTHAAAEDSSRQQRR